VKIMSPETKLQWLEIPRTVPGFLLIKERTGNNPENNNRFLLLNSLQLKSNYLLCVKNNSTGEPAVTCAFK